ncbi:hypothetical protein FPZ12_005480 [Amycolatopsis acidicola]|uniref:Phosphotriesterase-related protein n=1 Tax=Amycolatopsis acidicola TaxID=2596893 RepID=A0A5N0VLB3_9PSEU|nr:hypothetical protein [Amycolatopsis acidicola]KAA9165522.1 hypothetical protein FPZ12_005480 [Amycolatopsis acidicola]
MTAKLRTVLGDVDPAGMGATLPHEHIFGDVEMYWYPGGDPRAESDPDSVPRLDNLWHWRENPVANRGNLHMGDERDGIDEVGVLPELGVRTLVNLSPIGMGRNAAGLRQVSEATGVHIVAGSAYYVAESWPEERRSMTETQLAEEIVHEITVGMEGTGIRAGIVGEVGLSWPLDPLEERSLAASVRAHRETGAALSIHNPYYVPGAGPLREIGKRIAGLGADMSRVIMGHCDGFARDPEFLDIVAELGCYVELDLFGYSSGYEAEVDFVYPSDELRVNTILALIEAGLADRLLLSHDICFKTSRQKFGGSGYGYIHRVIVPWLRRKGAGDDALQQILVRNAQTVLPIVEPAA